jgi:hypothetical protein
LAVNPGARLEREGAAPIEGSPRPTNYPRINSSSLVTVRQFLPVLVVLSLESK